MPDRDRPPGPAVAAGVPDRDLDRGAAVDEDELQMIASDGESPEEASPVVDRRIPGGPLGRWVLHPLLLVAYPTLALWGANVHEVVTGEALGVLATTVVVAVVAWAVLAVCLALVGRGRFVARAGLVVSGAGLAVLTAGRFVPTESPVVGLAVVGMVIVALLAIAWRLSRMGLARLTMVANVFALVAVVMALLALRPALNPTRSDPVPVTFEGSDAPARDIWYIIPDRYPRADTLAADYDFDNSEFIDFLTDKGFQVQEHARANYPKTAHSLASTWNLAYLDELIPNPPADGADWSAVYNLLDDHRLGQFMVEAGFDYIHLGNWWGPTARSSVATQHRSISTESEFESVWRDTTALRWLGSVVQQEPIQAWGNRRRIHAISEYQFDELDRMVSEPHDRPRFILAHITVPHEPYVFNPDGSFVTDDQQAARGRVVNTTNQVEYVNRRLKQLVERLVTGDPAIDPIIVIQSDEGPHPDEQYAAGQAFNWLETTTENRAEKLRILSAWYLPGIDEPVPDDITSVNTWRFILDRYFGTDLGLLPDQVQVFEDEFHLYTFYDVTEEFD